MKQNSEFLAPLFALSVLLVVATVLLLVSCHREGIGGGTSVGHDPRVFVPTPYFSIASQSSLRDAQAAPLGAYLVLLHPEVLQILAEGTDPPDGIGAILVINSSDTNRLAGDNYDPGSLSGRISVTEKGAIVTSDGSFEPLLCLVNESFSHDTSGQIDAFRSAVESGKARSIDISNPSARDHVMFSDGSMRIDIDWLPIDIRTRLRNGSASMLINSSSLGWVLFVPRE